MDRRDFEFFVPSEDSEVTTFKFHWTIGGGQLNEEGCILPTIKLPGANLHFKLRYGCKDKVYKRIKRNVVYMSIFASCPMNISGTCTHNIGSRTHLSHLGDRSLYSGENKDVYFFTYTPRFDPVYKLVFDMKVTRFVQEEKGIASKNNEKGKIDADYCRLHLENDIKKLWETKRLSDVQIKVGDQTILAHKIILSARSPVFAAMFQNETTEEATKNVVDITDIPFDTMNLLVGFLYGQHPDFVGMKIMEKLYELYSACDKYEILYLRDVCGRVLVERMTPGNVDRLIDLFDRHSDSVLEKQVVDYCCLNFKDIVKAKDGENMVLEKVRFFSLVFEKMAKSNNI